MNQTNDSLKICLVDLKYWAGKTEHGYVGIYPSIFTRLMNKLEIDNYQFILAPYIRLQHMLDGGKCDLSITLADEKFAVIKGVLVWQIDSVVITAPEQHANKIADLKGLIIGLLRGAKIGANFDSIENLIKVETKNFLSLVKMLERKRIDAIAGDFKLVTNIAEQEHIKLGNVIHINQSPLPLNFVMAKKSHFIDDFERINSALKELVTSGEIEAQIMDVLGRAPSVESNKGLDKIKN